MQETLYVLSVQGRTELWPRTAVAKKKKKKKEGGVEGETME